MGREWLIFEAIIHLASLHANNDTLEDRKEDKFFEFCALISNETELMVVWSVCSTCLQV